jgi:hypothetical protein
MLRAAAFAAVIAAIAAPALAQEITLVPGEAVTLRLEGDATAGERGDAEWTPHDLAVAHHLAGLAPPKAPVGSPSQLPEGMPAAAPVRENVVRLRFLSIAGQHSLLIVENGYNRALVYRARMTREGRAEPTDVCLVTPRNRSYEHWPHPIEGIAIADLRLVPWRPGDPQPCR